MSFCSGIKETGFLEDSNQSMHGFWGTCYSEAKRERGLPNTEEDRVRKRSGTYRGKEKGELRRCECITGRTGQKGARPTHETRPPSG